MEQVSEKFTLKRARKLGNINDRVQSCDVLKHPGYLNFSVSNKYCANGDR